MVKTGIIVMLMGVANCCVSQSYTNYLSPDSLKSMVSFLASDSLKGRGNFTPELEKAAFFINDQFHAAGLSYFQDLPVYFSPFVIPDNTTSQASLLLIDNKPVKNQEYLFTSSFSITPTILYTDFVVVNTTYMERTALIRFINQKVVNTIKPLLVVLPPGKQSQIKDLKKHLQEINMPEHSLLVISGDTNISDLKISLNPAVRKRMLFNLIGMLPGKSKANETVIFSAHYDHMGSSYGVRGKDMIFNGANDNASGTAAMLSFMKYFSAKNDNERTLLFIAFAGEELGLTGSYVLSGQFNWNHVKAMFNLEMMGKPDEHGLKKVLVTNFSSSGLGGIMQKYCKDIRVIADDHPSEKLDQRSDHFPFFLKRIPAHTFMCFNKGDNTYHQVNDETSTLNFENFSDILKGMLPGIERVVSGVSTP